jgi:hypothetical protein
MISVHTYTAPMHCYIFSFEELDHTIIQIPIHSSSQPASPSHVRIVGRRICQGESSSTACAPNARNTRPYALSVELM